MAIFILMALLLNTYWQSRFCQQVRWMMYVLMPQMLMGQGMTDRLTTLYVSNSSSVPAILGHRTGKALELLYQVWACRPVDPPHLSGGVAQVDENTVEVCDFTVIIRGLPHNATPVQAGCWCTTPLQAR